MQALDLTNTIFNMWHDWVLACRGHACTAGGMLSCHVCILRQELRHRTTTDTGTTTDTEQQHKGQ
jgi:hypothetical protein